MIADATAEEAGFDRATVGGLTRLTARGEWTIDTAAGLEREVDRARRHGIAFDNEEIEPGLRCIAAGVRDDSGELVAGLSVSAPVERHSPDWAAMVKQTADAISLAIGYAPSLRQAEKQ